MEMWKYFVILTAIVLISYLLYSLSLIPAQRTAECAFNGLDNASICYDGLRSLFT